MKVERAEAIRLDGHMLRAGFYGAALAVIAQEATLNAINVFPVADGDTGSNLKGMMAAISWQSLPVGSPKTLLDAIAAQALMSARGNSGLIFSQYFHSLVAHCNCAEQLSLKELIALFDNAGNEVAQAIHQPVAGTLLTVMQQFAGHLRQADATALDVISLLQRVEPQLLADVAETKTQLAVLAKHGVVDAGAKAFYHFVCGFRHGLQQPIAIPAQAIDEMSFAAETLHQHQVIPEQRYCLEAIVKQFPKHSLRSHLARYGDSIVISGGEEKYRFHCHTNTPAAIFAGLKQAQFTQVKADDMWRQFQAQHAAIAPIAIVTDSVADIPAALIDAHQIHIIPMDIHHAERTYLDRLTLDTEAFYQLLSDPEYPTSAMPSPHAVSRQLSFLAAHYQHVIVITVSSQLSGFFQLTQGQAKAFDNVTVIDSALNSAAQGLLVLVAAKRIQAGQSWQTIVAATHRSRAQCQIFVAIAQLGSLIRSGRLPATLGRLLSALAVKPVIGLNAVGKGVIHSKNWGWKRTKRALLQHIVSAAKQRTPDDYVVVHTAAPNEAEALAATLTAHWGKAPYYITEAAPVIALHAGRGAVGVAML